MLSNLKVNALKTRALKLVQTHKPTKIFQTLTDRSSPQNTPLSSWQYFTILGFRARHLFSAQAETPPSQEMWLGNEKHVTTWRGATVLVGQGHA